jgi:excinuclease ABC subunit C
VEKPIVSFSFQSKQIPTDPGCYLFLDGEGIILYVGKAKNLRKRVSSYFQKTKKSSKTDSLVKKIRKIETRVVKTEMEALILENNLIKEHLPKYNILLRDDKNFLYLRITNEAFPRLEITRRIVRDGSFYLGPKTSAKKFRETIAFCQKVFQIRTCKLEFAKFEPGLKIIQNPENRKIPCLDFHIKKCSGPCAGSLSVEEYQSDIQRMKQFLRGDTREVIQDLQGKMMMAAKERNFEHAAKLRDLIQSIEASTLKQTVQFSDLTHRDFISFVRVDRSVFFVRIAFRNGKYLDQNEVEFRAEEFATEVEVLEQFLLQFYERVDEMPSEIYIPTEIENEAELVFLLSEKFEGVRCKIMVPQRGEKKQALEIAHKNAQKFAEQTQGQALSQAENFSKALPELAEVLGLSSPPRRIECYDISHFAGEQTVASQVVFVDGKPKKSEYRRFHIKDLKPGEIDDFKSLNEVLRRRFLGMKNEQFVFEKAAADIAKKMEEETREDASLEAEEPKEESRIPDLIVIDGGKGQLSAVMKLFLEGGADNALLPEGFDPQRQIISLAKRKEEVFVPGGSDPIELSKDSAASKLLQRLRDEAHRFAISFNRNLRTKVLIKSALDEISGIGPSTKKKLLSTLGSVSGIKNASDESLLQIINAKQLANIRKNL